MLQILRQGKDIIKDQEGWAKLLKVEAGREELFKLDKLVKQEPSLNEVEAPEPESQAAKDDGLYAKEKLEP